MCFTVQRRSKLSTLHQPKEQSLKMLSVTGAAKPSFNVNLPLSDILQLACLKKCSEALHTP